MKKWNTTNQVQEEEISYYYILLVVIISPKSYHLSPPQIKAAPLYTYIYIY